MAPIAPERRKETKRDRKFVDLGHYLYEVRAGEYWRLERQTYFDDCRLVAPVYGVTLKATP